MTKSARELKRAAVNLIRAQRAYNAAFTAAIEELAEAVTSG